MSDAVKNEQASDQTEGSPTDAAGTSAAGTSAAGTSAKAKATARRRAQVDLDELARLEEERRFLLRSISDLEREHAAGDVDQADYDDLIEGYTARAAAVLRTIEHGRAGLPGKRRTRPAAVAAWVLGTIAIAILAGWLLARSSGQRMAGEEMTGGQPADEVSVALSEARTLLGQQDFGGAFERFQRVTEIEPDNAEARTYTAWILVLNSRFLDDEAALQTSLDTAMTAFASVVEDDPRYADAHCLYAVTAGNFLPEPDLDIARLHGSLCLELNPPSAIQELVQGFLAGLDATAPDGVTATTSP